MLLNLENVPFTRRGSYLVISYVTSNFRIHDEEIEKAGLYLRGVRGNRFTPFIGELIPIKNNKPVEYSYRATPEEIIITIGGGSIRICFADKNTLLFQGEGNQIGLCLEISSGHIPYTYVHEVPYNGKLYYAANLFKNGNKLVMFNQRGRVKIDQKLTEGSSDKARVSFLSEKDGFLAALEEVRTEWKSRELCFDYDDCLNAVTAEIDSYTKSMPEVPDAYEKSRKLAAYINWSSEVAKDGFLSRDTIYCSKNWMIGAFSWDHCFPAIGLSYHNPELAWDQFMELFDYQDETGRLPDSIDDAKASWNFCKPPIHGWALMKMMEHMTLTKQQMEEAYTRLKKWTQWWYSYRDNDHDGVCEYYHGNDSGWDNATVFDVSETIESPELSAYLVLQNEALGMLAEKLGLAQESESWKKRAQKQLKDMLKHCFEGKKPVAKVSRTHETVDSDSLLPYLSIILGKRLPEVIAENMADTIKNGGFVTEYGIATEKVSSPNFRPDGYWRGPIWAPTTLLVLDGMYQLGEKDFVRDTVEKFGKLVKKSGFSENYDAVSGNGNRDRAYTWSAFAFLIMAHDFL